MSISILALCQKSDQTGKASPRWGLFCAQNRDWIVMSLAATLAAVQPNNIGGVCRIAKLIDTLPTADSIALHNALASPM
jgi:hypothetical protein